jgi:hypothetical protein
MTRSPNQQLFSLSLIRLVGYGLLILTLVEVVFIVFPPHLMNPTWELQTIGSFIERIPVPLLGIAFIYYGEKFYRAPIEFFLLKFLSWLSLFLAIAFFLMIPLNISNSIRIDYANNAKINSQIVSSIDKIKEFREQINQANSPEQIVDIVQKQTSSSGNLATNVDTEKLKNNLLQELESTEKNLRNQSEQTRSQQRMVLIKNSIKWNLGAAISSCLFFFIWKDTFWARLLQLEENDH